MRNIDIAINSIKNAKTLIIACHRNPDGDCIGSLLGLGIALKKIGKRVYLLSQDGVPKKYLKLPEANLIRKKINLKSDLAIAVDCNAKEMLGNVFNSFKRAKKIIEIDHHEFRRPFGDIELVDNNAAAVGEIIFRLIKELGIDIDSQIAENLLTSIIVETSSFRLPQVSQATFETCAKLISKDVDFYRLTKMVYWSRTRQDVVLSGLCLSRCRFLKNGKIVWSFAQKEDFRSARGKDEDIDAVADEMRAIEGVSIAVLFRQKNKGVLRVSLRSKGQINVAALAEKFGGGGHFDVAGCIVKDSEEIKRQILKEAEKLL